jgi:DNA-binding SARP family transcriptional activator
MRDVRLHLLGGFELVIDGVRAEDLQPGAQRLVAFVALTRRGVERDFAAFQLWPDTSEERARANLRSALWRSRRLSVALIDATPSRLRISDELWLDVRDGLDDMVADAENWSASPLSFQALLTDLLPDWYDDWLMIEREKIRQYTLRQLELRARSALDRGQPYEAIQVALTAMAMDPLREGPCRLVIEAHLSEGNEHEARRTATGFRDRLRDDLAGSMPADFASLVEDRSHQLATAAPR